MLMLGADEKKAINGIISILWRRDKEVIDMGQRRKKFARTVCQRPQMEAPCSSLKGLKRGQSEIPRFEPVMLPLKDRRRLHRSMHKSDDRFGGQRRTMEIQLILIRINFNWQKMSIITYIPH